MIVFVVCVFGVRVGCKANYSYSYSGELATPIIQEVDGLKYLSRFARPLEPQQNCNERHNYSTKHFSMPNPPYRRFTNITLCQDAEPFRPRLCCR
jgi:hypothetical protein